MNEIAIALLLAVCLLAFANWRSAFAVCVVTALLQDPARKLVPGQPVYFVVFVGVVFAAAWLGAYFGNVKLDPAGMIGWRKHVGKPFAVFLVVLLFACLNSLIQYGNPLMVAIGLSSYLAPLPAVVLAYRFALSRGEAGLIKWMRFYVLVATIALATVYMEYAGLTSSLFGEVGEGVLISGAGAYYKGNSGIFRAAEIAAWHAATVACFAFILFWGKRFSPPKFLVAGAFVVFLLGLGALTGRRKMVIEIAIFLSSYFFLIGWFRRGSTRFALLAAVLGVFACIGITQFTDTEAGDGTRASERLAHSEDGDFSKYTARARTVFEDLPGRLMDTGVRPVEWAVEGFGYFGGGMGTGSQGAQHFGAPPSGAAEGGLGKLTVELGVPGLIVTLWLFVALARYVLRILEALSRGSPAHANFAYGLVSFMVANIAAFSIATQAYADFFILLSLGWAFGFVIAMPLLAQSAEQRVTAAKQARARRDGPETSNAGAASAARRHG